MSLLVRDSGHIRLSDSTNSFLFDIDGYVRTGGQRNLLWCPNKNCNTGVTGCKNCVSKHNHVARMPCLRYRFSDRMVPSWAKEHTGPRLLWRTKRQIQIRPLWRYVMTTTTRSTRGLVGIHRYWAISTELKLECMNLLQRQLEYGACTIVSTTPLLYFS
jgi:hypothetical protein